MQQAIQWPENARYLWGSVLGQGGGGQVRLARRRGPGEWTLVGKCAHRGQEGALAREWQVLHDVVSDALPQPVAWLEPATLVMTLRPGIPLDQALADASLAQVIAITGALARALQPLHAAGLVHGDLHFSNLIVESLDDARVSLLDLGLCVRQGAALPGPGHLQTAAPEALRGEPADCRDDLFALGMSVWLAWQKSAPYLNYPSILPTPGDRPVLGSVRPDERAFLEILSGWIAPSRALRPASAEQACRSLGAIGAQYLEKTVVLRDLQALAERPWRWGRWPNMPDLLLPSAGMVTWCEGGAGLGKTGVVRALAAQARAQGRPVALLEGEGSAEPWIDAAQQLQLSLPPRIVPAEAEQVLTGNAAAEAAHQLACWQAVAAGLGPSGWLLIDDADHLAPATARALRHLQPVCAVVATVCEAPVGSEGAHWPLPPPTLAETAAALASACGGRHWPADLVEQLIAWTGSRRGVAQGAWAAVHAGLVEPTADAVVRVIGEGSARDLKLLVIPVQSPPLPAPSALPWLAGLAAAGPRGIDGPAPLDLDRRWLRRRADGRLVVANNAYIQEICRAVSPDQWAQALAAQLQSWPQDDPQRLGVWLQVHAAGLAPLPPAQAVLEAGQALIQQGQPDLATHLVRAYAAVLPSGQGVQANLQALTIESLAAQGKFTELDQQVNDVAQLPTSPVVRLALAQAAFVRGDYPQCRSLAEPLLQEADWSHKALLWLGFAATWQGDRPAAAAAVARGLSLSATDEAHDLFAYLQALGAYYAGELGQSQAQFAALADSTLASVRAAAQGGLGLVAHRRGDLDLARQCYRNARELAEVAGDYPRALNMAMNAAVLDHDQGDLGRALEGYDRVIAAAKELNNPGALARACNNRGNLWALLGDDTAALADLDLALQAMAASGNGYLEGNVRCVLAELARRAGQISTADAQLQKAEAAIAAAGANNEHLEMRLERAQLAAARGNSALAHRLFLELRVAAARLGNAEQEARALLGLGQQLLDLPEVLSESRNQALEHLQAAQQLAPASKALLGVAIAAELARAQLFAGNVAQARTTARQTQDQLAQVARTLPPHVAHAFALAPSRLPLRNTLQILANLPESLRAPGQLASLGGALSALLAINRQLSSEHDVAALLERVMDAAVLLTGAERGFLLLEEPEDVTGRRTTDLEARLRIAVARNLDRENLKKPQHKLSQSVAMSVFAAGEAVLATDAQLDERFADQASIHHGSLRSILCVPMNLQGRPIGVVYVDNRFTAGAFSGEHRGVLEALADQAAIAIHTARLLEAARRTAGELASSRAQVHALNEQLQERLDAAESALVNVRADMEAQRLDTARRSEFSRIRGESEKLHKLFDLMARVRDHDFPVLLRGESGTGKELVARAIHFTGRRRKGPFVAINCAALPGNLLESELFGHSRGSFTGATADRRGLFEAASGGTLLLDEVGEMPLDMQPKLLRVLQTNEITRVGETAPRKVDVRVLAATHRDLLAMVAQGQFREDLLYRLRVVELEIPPLRQRPEDIPILAEHFLAENRAAGVGQVQRIAPAALQRLQRYGWPGNVRQLEMLLKSACLFANGPVLHLADVEPLLLREGGSDLCPEVAGLAGDGQGSLESLVLELCVQRLAALGGNKKRAAESLGINRVTLYNHLKKAEMFQRGGAQRTSAQPEGAASRSL